MSAQHAVWRGFRPEPDVLHKVSPTSIWCYKKPEACGTDSVDYVAVCITCEPWFSAMLPPPLTATSPCRRSLPPLTAAACTPLLPASVNNCNATTIPTAVLNGFIEPPEVSCVVVLKVPKVLRGVWGSLGGVGP